MFISELLVTNEIMEQGIEKKWDQPGEVVKALLAETHLEVWRQFQLFIEKEKPKEHEACGIEVAEEREMVGPPPKETKGEKAEETAESSEAEETTENVQGSVDYNKFYSKFIQRALDTIRDKFDFIQNHIDNHGVFSQIEKIRSITGYIDMLQKIFTVVQQIEEKDKRKEYHSKLVADSPSFVQCWASRWLLK